MNPILTKYAHLLCSYCVSLKPGDKVYIKSTTLAEPLVREVYRIALQMGAIPEVSLEFQSQDKMLLEYGNEEQIRYVPMLHEQAMESFDAYIFIKAPFNLREGQHPDDQKRSWRQEALKRSQQLYFKRTSTYDLKRTFCIYPTLAGAQEAGMSLDEYEYFVYNACFLMEEDPAASWLDLKEKQQIIVDVLNQHKTIRYKGSSFDISFSTVGRKWINSFGTTNMPSGEVYTSPVEDSVNGTVHFTYPIIYNGEEIQGVTLWVIDGLIEKWEALRGGAALDKIMQIPGARRFGEAAIGTNKRIDRFTRNILFDEKIGGTIHMAIGQSYLQAGGQNESAIHLDMIAKMDDGGQIFADGKLIYENGEFLFTNG